MQTAGLLMYSFYFNLVDKAGKKMQHEIQAMIT